MAPSTEAFPTGIYAKYKQTTQYFLTWLLRAREGQVGDAKKHPLDVYEGVVRAIAKDPTVLSPALLHMFPHAMEACESAITLREHVAVYFAELADDAHAHFLQRLKSWFGTLKQTRRECRRSAEKAKHVDQAQATEAVEKTVDFSNYYDVLALPDDYFDDDSSDVASPLTVRPLSAAEKKSLRDDIFARDLNAELACLFMELDVLSEAVYLAFHDVKRDEKSLIEATAIAEMAIDRAMSVLAGLQVRYPSIRDAEDLSILIKSRMSIVEFDRLLGRVNKAWQPVADPSVVTYQYVPGTILVDVMWLTSTLLNIGVDIREKHREISLTGRRAQMYSEETTRHYTVPDCHTYSQFLIHHLIPLLDSTHRICHLKVDTSMPLLQMWFIRPFERFSATGTVTLRLLFACICWIRSVAALQGCRGLSQTISLTVMHHWELADRVAAAMDNGVGVFREEMEFAQKGLQGMESFVPYHVVNPLFAGCVLLDAQFKCLDLGHMKLTHTVSFLVFAHVYSALCDRQLLERIPLSSHRPAPRRSADRFRRRISQDKASTPLACAKGWN